MSSALSATKERHPWSLKWLFSVEMWERFGFYLMLGILTLFLTDKKKGGFGYTDELAAEVYGTFYALCYIMPFIGGMVAERIIGFRKSILFGALMMMGGYFLLATVTPITFYLGLLLIVLGNGFFKPNISAMLGKFYPDDSELKDSGFNIFYMGINIAGFFCNFVAAYLRHNYGWDYAFAGAGIGMALAILIFLIVYKRLKPIDDIIALARKEPRDPGEVGFKYMAKWVLPPVVILGGFGFWLFGTNWGFLLACLPIVVFYIQLWVTSKKNEKGPLGALLVVLIVSLPFWTIYSLNGAAFTFWAQDYTEREFQDNKVLDWTMYTFRFAEEAGSDSYYFAKDKPQSMQTSIPAEGQKVRLLSTEIMQSINPFFIVTLIPLIVLFLGFLRTRRKEPSTPSKIGIGLLLSAVSMVVMLFASFASSGGAFKVSVWWLISVYFLATAAECFVSPVGLTLVSKMAPIRFTAVMMGGWFLIMAMGGKLAGDASGLMKKIPLEALFIGLAVFALIFTAIVFILLRWLNQYMPKSKEG